VEIDPVKREYDSVNDGARTLSGQIHSFFREAVAERRLLAALLGAALLYVALALTPSHYGMGLRLLGFDARPLIGVARLVRSDEWIVLTPLFQIAVHGNFGSTNVISPYQETLKGFYALPILDWSLLFKPQLWGFWLLPPAYAYSLYFAILWSSFLAGYTILLRQLGASLLIATFGSLALFSSHLVQVWWTSQSPTFAFAPWPLIVLLLSLRPIWKIPLLFWVSSVWVLALVYPPFMVPAGFAIGVLLLAFRRDAITAGNVVAVAIALIGAGMIFFLYFGDLISVMRNTVYPGDRYVGGGGEERMKLLAHLLPFFTTSRFSPLLSNSNECEVAVVSTLLPLTIIFFAKYRSAISCVRENQFAAWIVTAGLTTMLAWMMLPVPASVGKLLLWTQVQPARMAWAFGLLLTLSLIVFSSKLEFRISGLRFFGFSVTVLAAWLASKIGFAEIWSKTNITAFKTNVTALGMLYRSWFDWIAIVPFGIVTFLAAQRKSIARNPTDTLFASAAITGLATFGTFNPLQPAHLIFDLPKTPFQEQLRENARANPNGWAVVPGMYGALLNGAAIPSINHTLMAPRLDFFRRVFPDLPAEQFNQTFNRYAHIIPKEGTEPHSPSPDVIVVPIAPFLTPVPN
jgi:hypothetical protein